MSCYALVRKTLTREDMWKKLNCGGKKCISTKCREIENNAVAMRNIPTLASMKNNE